MNRFALVVALLLPSVVFAGGYEIPDTGTVALGRGGAFAAKADDGTAIEYNVAGLAGQRGTRLLFDSNLLWQSFSFARSGTYPSGPMEMYGGQPYPVVSSTNGVFYDPFVVLSSDFGLKRWTFAIGLFGPSAVGNKTYPATVDGKPSPARYDLVSENLLIAYPTVAVGFHAARWLDLGLALHVVVAKLDFSQMSSADLGALCQPSNTPRCDSLTHLQTSGVTAAAQFGALLHPARWLDIGASVRSPIILNTSGTIDATPPSVAPIIITPESATFKAELPWVARLGARYIFRRPDDSELADIEADGVYEAWGESEGVGDTLDVPELGPFTNIHAVIPRHYHDTFSGRLGAAYHLALPGGELAFRLGGYYDEAATSTAWTRVDFDTLDKWAGTVGLGYTWHGITLDAAYAYVYSPPRTVTDGQLRAINGVNGSTTASTGMPMPVVNNGKYDVHTQILSLGLKIRWDVLLHRHRG